MSVAVTLKQEKTVLTDKFRVVSWITNALPVDLYPLFVMETGLDPWEELYDRVATLDDLARYLENPLTRFADSVVDFSGLTPVTGDVLIITSALPEWESAFLARTAGPPSGFRFSLNMSGVGSVPYVVVDFTTPLWKAFPDARPGLAWTLKNSTETVTKGSGTLGYTRARNDISDQFLRRHLTALYALAAQAEAHAQSVDTGVHSVATAADTTPPPFGGFSEHTYP
jgi:hypothetical protein